MNGCTPWSDGQGTRAIVCRRGPAPKVHAQRAKLDKTLCGRALSRTIQTGPAEQVTCSPCRDKQRSASRDWSEVERELFEERAAIVEHHGGASREAAEQLARAEIMARGGSAPSRSPDGVS